MPVFGAQGLRQRTGAAEAQRAALDVDQQRRAGGGRQRRQLAQAAVGEQPELLAFAGMAALPARQPFAGLGQRGGQWGAATGAELLQPAPRGLRGALALAEPARFCAVRLQQGQCHAAAARLVEQFGEQALGAAQGAVAAGRGRGIDDDQPQRRRAGQPAAVMQFGARARPAALQAARPVDAAGAGRTGAAARSRLGRVPLSGIRAPGGLRADAQGFFAQRGGARRSPTATGCAGNSPHWPSPSLRSPR